MRTMTIEVKVKPQKQPEFMQAIRALSDNCDNHRSFGKGILPRQMDDKACFSLTYEWETHEDLERCLREEKFRVLLGALEVLCDESEIKCDGISEKHLARLRGMSQPCFKPQTARRR